MVIRNRVGCFRTLVLSVAVASLSCAGFPMRANAGDPKPDRALSSEMDLFDDDFDDDFDYDIDYDIDYDKGDPVKKAAERLRNATPEMREARLERMAMRLMTASRWERRRILRREGRILRALPEKDRAKIESENEAFREKHGILSIRDRRDLAESGEFDFSAKERRVLRARVRDLPAQERRELMHKIKHVRELPEADKQKLHERLNEMKSLSDDERDEFREKAKRWGEMSEERRDKLRAQMKKLREMPIDERMELLERAMEGAEGYE